MSTIQKNVVKALGDIAIPVSCSFNLLPDSGDSSPLDTYVDAIVDQWAGTWKTTRPFVFVDPYPDNTLFKNAQGVFDYQGRVSSRYAEKHTDVQIFIAETGGEGCGDNTCTDGFVKSLFQQLTAQRTSHGITVPTFFCEAINEGLKPSAPDLRNMGLFDTSSTVGKGTETTLRAHSKINSHFRVEVCRYIWLRPIELNRNCSGLQ